MSRSPAWPALVASLAQEYDVREVEPGQRLRLTVVGESSASAAGAIIEIAMTPDEWDEFIGMTYADLDLALEGVRRTVRTAVAEEVRYLVYYQYQLERSERPHILKAPPGTVVDLADLLAQQDT
jgi:phage protein D